MSYIYGIFIGDKCIYIGSTDDYEQRWKQHKNALKKGKHTNKSIQKQYDMNAELFDYRIIKEIHSNSTLIKFFSECLYNSCTSLHATNALLHKVEIELY